MNALSTHFIVAMNVRNNYGWCFFIKGVTEAVL